MKTAGIQRLVMVGVLTTLVAPNARAQPAAKPDDPEAVRAAITAVNSTWSRVRLTYDSAKAESLLEPGFYAAVRGRNVSRDEFIKTISTRSPTTRLVRFDNPVTTIIKGEGPGEWIALVQEKLEFERTAPDGGITRSYSLWYTRDGYREIAPGRWRLMYTQEVMHQSWSGGQKPPFTDWGP